MKHIKVIGKILEVEKIVDRPVEVIKEVPVEVIKEIKAIVDLEPLKDTIANILDSDFKVDVVETLDEIEKNTRPKEIQDVKITNWKEISKYVAVGGGGGMGAVSISGPFELGPTTLAALESTTVAVSNFPATQPVSGTVELGTTTLTALENTTISINGLPSLTNTQVSVPVTQVAIPTTNLASRKTISIKALAANGAEVYIGLTGVLATTGYELSAGDAIEIDCDATVNLFAISASGTQKVSIIEVA